MKGRAAAEWRIKRLHACAGQSACCAVHPISQLTMMIRSNSRTPETCSCCGQSAGMAVYVGVTKRCHSGCRCIVSDMRAAPGERTRSRGWDRIEQ